MTAYCIYCMRPSDSDTCPHCGKKRSAYEAAPHQLAAGSRLHDKYYIGTVLGEGGFGITYVGRDLTLDMKVAIKEYYPNGIVNRNNTVSQEITHTMNEAGARFDKGKRDFLTEARTLAKFANEQHCVSVRDFFEENNTAYIVMEYLDGMPLKEYLERHGKFTFDEMLGLLRPVMQVLGKVHAQGLIHRDISPANIMVLEDNEAKLLDFGAARDVSGNDEKSLSILLKPGYAPEEQYRTRGKQGPWTDIYALSATMYKLMTGVTPLDSMNRVFEDDLQPITALNPAVTQAQSDAILKGMAVRQEDRYQTIAEMLQAFEGLTTPAPTAAKAPKAAPKPVKAPAPQPAAAAAPQSTGKKVPVPLIAGISAGVLAVAGIGIGIGVAVGSKKPETVPSQQLEVSEAEVSQAEAIPEQKPTETPAENATAINTKAPMFIDPDGLFVIDTDLLGLRLSEIDEKLGMTLDAPVEFPYWADNLKITNGCYNGIDFSIVFRRKRAVMIVHDDMGYLNQTTFDAATRKYQQVDDVNFFTKNMHLFQMYEDVYAEDGTEVVHQRYVVNDFEW